jgi:hypothetical protein
MNFKCLYEKRTLKGTLKLVKIILSMEDGVKENEGGMLAYMEMPQ